MSKRLTRAEIGEMVQACGLDPMVLRALGEVARLRGIIEASRPTDDSWPRDDDGPADTILAAEAKAIREEARMILEEEGR